MDLGNRSWCSGCQGHVSQEPLARRRPSSKALATPRTAGRRPSAFWGPGVPRGCAMLQEASLIDQSTQAKPGVGDPAKRLLLPVGIQIIAATPSGSDAKLLQEWKDLTGNRRRPESARTGAVNPSTVRTCVTSWTWRYGRRRARCRSASTPGDCLILPHHCRRRRNLSLNPSGTRQRIPRDSHVPQTATGGHEDRDGAGGHEDRDAAGGTSAKGIPAAHRHHLGIRRIFWAGALPDSFTQAQRFTTRLAGT